MNDLAHMVRRNGPSVGDHPLSCVVLSLCLAALQGTPSCLHRVNADELQSSVRTGNFSESCSVPGYFHSRRAHVHVSTRGHAKQYSLPGQRLKELSQSRLLLWKSTGTISQQVSRQSAVETKQGFPQECFALSKQKAKACLMAKVKDISATEFWAPGEAAADQLVP